MPDIYLRTLGDTAALQALEGDDTGWLAQRPTAELLRDENDQWSHHESLTELSMDLPPAQAASFNPDYVAGIANALACSPVIVLIRRGHRPVGALFAAQQRILGQTIGSVNLGNPCGDAFLLAPEGDRRAMLAVALSSLISDPRVHTLRVRIKDDDDLLGVFEDCPGALLNRQIVETRDLLRLSGSFDGFLRTLGRHTRRNLRYYRRRATLHGWQFASSLSHDEIMAALGQLAALQRTSRYRYSVLTRLANAVHRTPNPYFAGMRIPGGEWLSVLAGWHNGSHGYVLFQLNRVGAEYDGASLSLALRSHYLEQSIERGVRDVRFIGGCQGLLKRYCEVERHELLTLRKPGWRPKLFLAEERCRRWASTWHGKVFR
jgi:hypothetical protein